MKLLYSARVTVNWDEVQTVLQTGGPAGLKDFLIEQAAQDSRLQTYARASRFRIDTAPATVEASNPTCHPCTLVQFRLEVRDL